MRCIFSYIHENKVTVSLSKCRQCYLILLKGIRKELLLFRETAPFQSPFTTRIGIRMTYSHLKPPGPQGVIKESILSKKRGITYMVI